MLDTAEMIGSPLWEGLGDVVGGQLYLECRVVAERRTGDQDGPLLQNGDASQSGPPDGFTRGLDSFSTARGINPGASILRGIYEGRTGRRRLIDVYFTLRGFLQDAFSLAQGLSFDWQSNSP